MLVQAVKCFRAVRKVLQGVLGTVLAYSAQSLKLMHRRQLRQDSYVSTAVCGDFQVLKE